MPMPSFLACGFDNRIHPPVASVRNSKLEPEPCQIALALGISFKFLPSRVAPRPQSLENGDGTAIIRCL
jgi:hypothetical protein